MDEPPSPLLKSRIPRKTKLVDTDFPSLGYFIRDAHCPLRKGIICYRQNGTIFEHNIHSSGKHEPRIIVPKHPSREVIKMSFVPIKGNRILLFAKYTAPFISNYLHLAIHEICSDHRIGAALWSFNGSVDDRFDIRPLELIKSTENELGITFRVLYDDHWKLFDISTTDTDTSNDFCLIESGRIDFDLKFMSRSISHPIPIALSPDAHILLNVDMEDRHNDMIDIHYWDPGATNFSFVTRMSIPLLKVKDLFVAPELAFSADGSKVVMGRNRHGVSVWDIRSKVLLRTFTELPWPDGSQPRNERFLQFSCGNLGKEILVFVEHDHQEHSDLGIIHVIDATSFETEERLFLKYKGCTVLALFFDPREGTMYVELDGTIYEWDLRKKEPGPEWWIGEE